MLSRLPRSFSERAGSTNAWRDLRVVLGGAVVAETQIYSFALTGSTPHTCAIVGIVNAVPGAARCRRQSAEASVRSRSFKRPSLWIVPRSGSTVDGK